MTKKIGVINYGSGNFTSVYNAFRSLAPEVRVIDRPEELLSVTHLVLPGVGSFISAMERLTKMGLVDSLNKAILTGRPFLGICVGMQVLADVGFEHGEFRGLGILSGAVKKIDSHGLRLPHIGWNEVEPVRENILYCGMRKPIFYFVHSYHFVSNSLSVVSGTCDYGNKIVCSVSHENIHGVQFHPEKSQRDGLHLLKNFISA